MAIYTYRCKQCGWATEVVQSIKSYCEHPHVPVCLGDVSHGKMERYLTPTLVSFDTAPWAAYRSPIDGEVIDSRAKRNEHMAKHGVVMYDDLKPDFERNRKRIMKEAVADVKQDMIEAVHMLEAGYKPQIIPEAELIPSA